LIVGYEVIGIAQAVKQYGRTVEFGLEQPVIVIMDRKGAQPIPVARGMPEIMYGIVNQDLVIRCTGLENFLAVFHILVQVVEMMVYAVGWGEICLGIK